MKKLGTGWQYTVYDLGNGRVLKKFHSRLTSYRVILKDIFPFTADSFWEIPSFSKGMKEKAIGSFQVLKKHTLPPEWIGNPSFVSELDFTQDKVQPLHDVFEKSTVEESKRVIDRFVAFNKDLLARGIIDKSFNITKNYGMREDSSLVLIDIGELYDDPERIREQIRDRAWSKSYVAGCLTDSEVRNYFIEQMDTNFTV